MDPQSDMASLHLAIDDATGRITGGWFDAETLNGYYHVFHQILCTVSPTSSFTDRRTVFTYKKKNSPSIIKDTYSLPMPVNSWG